MTPPKNTDPDEEPKAPEEPVADAAPVEDAVADDAVVEDAVVEDAVVENAAVDVAVDDPPAAAAEVPAAPARKLPRVRRAKADPPKAATADAPKAEKASKADKTEAKPARRSLRGRKAADAKPAETKPQRSRAARDRSGAPPLVSAHARYVRTSARKARMVCDLVRGKDVVEARAILAYANRDVARAWTKLLESAVANAENNHELIGEELKIASVKADEGPTLKRFQPRAMGRATPIRKRTSHLSITLTPKD